MLIGLIGFKLILLIQLLLVCQGLTIGLHKQNGSIIQFKCVQRSLMGLLGQSCQVLLDSKFPFVTSIDRVASRTMSPL
jgi:hypothetical protein